MEPWEIKLQAEKARYADQCNEQAQAVGRAIGRDEGKLTPGEELLIHRLQRKSYQNENEKRKLDRAIDILTRHPEFQEFLELLRSDFV